jgi:hypothetical protein
MRGKLAAGAIVVTLAGCGGGDDGPAVLSLHLKGRAAVYYGSSVTLWGRVKSGGLDEVAIEENAWPHAGFRRVATVPVKDGGFELRRKPEVNTLYRAVAPGEDGEPTEEAALYVYPLAHMNPTQLPDGRYVLNAATDISDIAKPRLEPFIFYVHPPGQRHFRRLASKRPRLFNGQVVARVVTQRRYPPRTAFLYCTRNGEADGMGNPSLPTPHEPSNCGARIAGPPAS